MTHDELLAKLWILPADVTELQHGAKAVQALRVVVELHKPATENSFTNNGCICMLPNRKCPTIQAIEEKLDD
jgi:hypothetical protein